MGSLIVHSLRMHKVQTLSVFVTVALSVALALVLGLIYGGSTRGMQLSQEQGGADILVIPEDAASYVTDTELLYTGAPIAMYMDESIADEVTAIDGVQSASAQFYSQTLNSSCCSASEATRLIGVDFSTDFVVTPLLAADEVDGLADDEVVVGSGVESSTFDGKITIYDVDYTVVGVLAQSGGELDYSIVMDIDNARTISQQTDGLDYLWDEYGTADTLVSCIMVDVVDDDALESVETALNLTDGVAYIESSDALERVQSQMQSFFVLLAVAAAIMFLITLLQLFARFYSCVWERKGELALYRAIGAKLGDVRKLIGGEIACIVGGGLVVGLVLGAALYAGTLALLQGSMSFPFVGLAAGQVALLVLAIVIVFAIVAALAVLWPLSQLSRLDPSLVMQQGDID